MRRTYVARGCLYCGLQLPDSAKFCPECGRSIERGFRIRVIQESKLDCPRKEMKGTGISSDKPARGREGILKDAFGYRALRGRRHGRRQARVPTPSPTSAPAPTTINRGRSAWGTDSEGPYAVTVANQRLIKRRLTTSTSRR